MDIVTQFVVANFVGTAAHVIMPMMLVGFLGCVGSRIMLYYYSRAQYKFSLEFEKRARAALNEAITNPSGGAAKGTGYFQDFIGDMLGKTYHECFELRSRFKRRHFDRVMSLTDRLFLIQDGVQLLVNDTQRRIRYLKPDSTSFARFVEISKYVFDSNPYFNKMIGVFPTGLVNELTNIMPGLFIIAGIFGTFLGIAHGLPELGAMDLTKPEEAKSIMDAFLVSISQAMVKSIVGIFLSVTTSLLNTFFSPEALFYGAINRFSTTLELAWNETQDAHVPVGDAASERSRRIAA